LFTLQSLLISLVLLFSHYAYSSPWIAVGDARLKNDLHLLNDSGAMPISLTTWPIMWADVKSAIDKFESTDPKIELNAAQKSALKELKFELNYQTHQGFKESVTVQADTSRTLFRNFASSHRERGELTQELAWDGERLSGNLQTNLTPGTGNSDRDVEVQFDGSYVAGVLGEWVLGFGAIDRWWGGGSQSSLILTNNARPVPALIFRTKSTQHFETPLLAWIGNWQFVSFLGQLESDRTISKGKLIGMRFTFKPLPYLEFGLSRAMQWGGANRDESFKAFLKSLSSKGENTSSKSGNQLGGFDVRYNFKVRELSLALYSQMIGEDEAGYMPAKYTFQFGAESFYALKGGNVLKSFIEYNNTFAGALGGRHPNVAYEHSVFQTGYRYRGRVMGASVDNDSKVYSLGGAYQQTDGQLSSFTINYMQLNVDGSAGGNTVSLDAKNLFYFELNHQMFLLGGQFNVGASYQSKGLNTPQKGINQTAVFTSWKYRFK